MIQSSVYRAFILNESGGIQRAEIVAAGDDGEALAFVGSMTNDHGIELWDRERLIGLSRPRPLQAEGTP